MRKNIILVLIMIISPAYIYAGEIYGNIKIESGSIGKGILVEVESAAGTISKISTDEFGSYSIYVKETGDCKLTVHYEGQSPSISVFSYQGSVRYNLVLLKSGDSYYIKRQ